MADKETKALQAREKSQLATSAEQTRPGPTFTPAVDIFETEREIALLADIPGVKAKDLNIDLRENVLTLTGEVASPESPEQIPSSVAMARSKYFPAVPKSRCRQAMLYRLKRPVGADLDVRNNRYSE